MKIKKDDNVIVITGAYKGKTGKVMRAYPETGKILIEGINLHKKHVRSRQEGKSGQTIDKAYPLQVSNVMIIDPKTNKRSRVGRKKTGDKWVRVAKKSGTALDK